MNFFAWVLLALCLVISCKAENIVINVEQVVGSGCEEHGSSGCNHEAPPQEGNGGAGEAPISPDSEDQGIETTTEEDQTTTEFDPCASVEIPSASSQSSWSFYGLPIVLVNLSSTYFEAGCICKEIGMSIVYNPIDDDFKDYLHAQFPSLTSHWINTTYTMFGHVYTGYPSFSMNFEAGAVATPADCIAVVMSSQYLNISSCTAEFPVLCMEDNYID